MLNLSNIDSIKYNLSFNFIYEIKNRSIKFYSSNFSIVKAPSYENCEYIGNFRCVNYIITPTSQFKLISNKFITINVKIKFDKNFNILNKEFIYPDFNTKNNYFLAFIGIEDIRLINFNDTIKYIGIGCVDKYRSDKNGVVFSDYNEYINNPFNINITQIDKNINRKIIEKNWVCFERNNELYIIYEWNPLTICKIIDNKLVLVKKMPNNNLFNELRGSTHGVKIEEFSEIWFICHNKQYYCYFLIFDLNMNFKKISSAFKFENCKVEYCICLFVENKDIYIGYSTFDNTSILKKFNKDILFNYIGLS